MMGEILADFWIERSKPPKTGISILNDIRPEET